METIEKDPEFVYYFDNIEFKLQIDKYWNTIYKGKPREKLYDSYTILLDEVKKVSKDKFVLDVGTNHSIFATPCSLLGYKILGFEPVKANFESSVTNMSINNCKDWYLFNYALSDENKEAIIYVPECPDNASLSKQAAISNMVRKGFYEEEITCIKFDDWIEGHPEFKNIGFIKIDTQGSEVKVVEGMQNFLSSSNDIYLVAEYEHHLLSMGYTYQQLDELLLSLGFEFVKNLSSTDKLFYKK